MAYPRYASSKAYMNEKVFLIVTDNNGFPKLAKIASAKRLGIADASGFTALPSCYLLYILFPISHIKQKVHIKYVKKLFLFILICSMAKLKEKYYSLLRIYI
jgi:hypothetical protein